MMAGMDDKDDLEDEITLEAMSGLAKILAKLDENNVRQILINICLRIRPCFEKVGETIAVSSLSSRLGFGAFAPGSSLLDCFARVCRLLRARV